MRQRRTSLRDTSGQALVEFVLVVPLLLLLVIGMLEFGRAINYWIDTTHLANQAARFAAVDRNPGGTGSLNDFVKAQGTTKELRDGGKSVSTPLNVAICFPAGTSKVGDPVRAVVTATYKWLPFLKIKTATTTLRGIATMRIESPPTAYSGSTTCPS